MNEFEFEFEFDFNYTNLQGAATVKQSRGGRPEEEDDCENNMNQRMMDHYEMPSRIHNKMELPRSQLCREDFLV